MKLYALQPEVMQHDGHSVLHAFQPSDAQMCDLLVRESLQNSLDAAKPESSEVKVDFSIGNPTLDSLMKSMEHAATLLPPELFKGRHPCLSIRDSGTYGLRGMETKDITPGAVRDYVNLVYEVMHQDKPATAGGSHGLGKTLFTHIGIGLVFYYSQFFQEGQWMQRLAACLIFDNKQPANALRLSILPCGIGWWGRSSTSSTVKPLPIVDNPEIEQIIGLLGIKPYAKGESGTTVIVPGLELEKFSNAGGSPIRQEELLQNIEKSARKWYFLRINPVESDKKPRLAMTLNGLQLQRDMPPVMHLLRCMYANAIEALNVQSRDDIDFDAQTPTGSAVCKRKAVMRVVQGGAVRELIGWLITSRITDPALVYEFPQTNRSDPYEQLQLDPIMPARPILALVRRPGMVVRFHTDAASWGCNASLESGWVLGLFVVNSDESLIDFPGVTIEKICRDSERSDHFDWAAITSNILQSAQKRVKVLLSLECTGDRSLRQFEPNSLGELYGRLLLPGKRQKNKSETRKPRMGKNPVISIGEAEYQVDGIVLKFRMALPAGIKCALNISLSGEAGVIDKEAWVKASTNSFPYAIVSVKLKQISGTGKGRPSGLDEILNATKSNLRVINYSLDAKWNSGKPIFEVQKKALYLDGEIFLKTVMPSSGFQINVSRLN